MIDEEDDGENWKSLAEEIYALRSNNHKSNYNHMKQVFKENEKLLAPLMLRCPRFAVILSHILEDKFGFRARKVEYTLGMEDWRDEECKRVGCSLALFIRKRKAGSVAVDAWSRHYPQISELFEEVEGFREVMLVIANNTLRDSIYGMAFRVSVGAALSLIDATTDIYVITT